MNRYVSSAALTMLAVSFTIFAQDRKIQPSALPATVQRTVQDRSQGATIKGYSTEVEHGKKVYEVEMIVNSHTKDLQIAADGTLNEVEEEVAFDSLPGAVQATLTKKAAGAKITKVESLTKHGKLVAYEASTLKGMKKGEIQVGPDGAKLSHEE
jgi:uncharacterized membrane protein YkoI